LNLDGEVIGVNAAIASESGGFEGIGFAIPSNMAVHIADALIKNGKVVRGWLGVTLKDLAPDAVKDMKLDIAKGALIGDVFKGSPADQAGVRKDDVVTEYDGDAVEDAATLQNKIANSAIGKEVALTIVRDGKTMTIKATIGDMQDAVKQMAESVKDRLGVVVRPVTDEEAEKYGLNEPRGVAVQSLVFHGALAQLGFEKNDLILVIDEQPVNDVQTFVNIVEALKPHQRIQLLALDHRSGQTGTFQATLNRFECFAVLSPRGMGPGSGEGVGRKRISKAFAANEKLNRAG
jgi:serine protease Do